MKSKGMSNTKVRVDMTCGNEGEERKWGRGTQVASKVPVVFYFLTKVEFYYSFYTVHTNLIYSVVEIYFTIKLQFK